ncbi:Lysozyme inhibitor LprI N-terminal domain-containing protein [Pararobbsia alpina]|uniref:lysozyme inhibitor LprI family protein n=1 Tax=Pararobbsia alpina TaxID=621374 RepID=UPI0039A4DE89
MARLFLNNKNGLNRSKQRVLSGFALASMLLLAQAVYAQDSDCQQDAAGADSASCARSAFVDADAKLNDAYRSALNLLSTDDKHAQAKSALIASQRAWLKFRDADCKVQNTLFEQGPSREAMTESCMTDLTEERTDELQQIWLP